MAIPGWVQGAVMAVAGMAGVAAHQQEEQHRDESAESGGKVLLPERDGGFRHSDFQPGDEVRVGKREGLVVGVDEKQIDVGIDTNNDRMPDETIRAPKSEVTSWTSKIADAGNDKTYQR